MIESLAHAIRKKRAILFVGAGVSMALGLPSWEQLIKRMGEELDFDPDVFAMPGANYLTIAEYYRLQRGSFGPLRSWMDRNWVVPHDVLKGSEVHNSIVDLGFPLIYTTNYDTNLEDIYKMRGKPFTKISTALDISTSTHELPQIVKFHGDFERDESIVLSESDYFERLDFESPVDIKFRADAFGKTILFIGDSLSDVNIRLLLYKIHKAWKISGFYEHRPESFVFMSKPDQFKKKFSIIGDFRQL